MRRLKKGVAILLAVMMGGLTVGCSGDRSRPANKETNEIVELIWCQIGSEQEDSAKVLEKVNEYTKEKIGVTINIRYLGWFDYNKTCQVIISTGEYYDMMFTSSWANNFYGYANKGAFYPLSDLIDEYGADIKLLINQTFWDAASVNGEIYAVPSEKEIVSMPMWTFTKEYVDKYNIPYEELHTLEDLEPWLEIIKQNEPDIVPLYLTKSFTPPIYMDEIVSSLGIEYTSAPNNLKVVNLFETEKMKETLQTLRRYYLKGYINADAAITSDDESVRRFVTKGDGQPYADRVWSRNLGYEVVTSIIMESEITTYSARGAMTSISKSSKHPEKAVEFLNLVNTDEYLRNLLNYGIEGLHYSKVEATAEEIAELGNEQVPYYVKVSYDEENASKYNVPYWVQGGLFNTYVPEGEPLDKWNKFKELNANATLAPSFGFEFNSEEYSAEIEKFDNILGEFGPALYTGSVDPDTVLPLLLKKLEDNGIKKVQKEMQKQLGIWMNKK